MNALKCGKKPVRRAKGKPPCFLSRSEKKTAVRVPYSLLLFLVFTLLSPCFPVLFPGKSFLKEKRKIGQISTSVKTGQWSVASSASRSVTMANLSAVKSPMPMMWSMDTFTSCFSEGILP